MTQSSLQELFSSLARLQVNVCCGTVNLSPAEYFEFDPLAQIAYLLKN